jgi:hypothetical protein
MVESSSSRADAAIGESQLKSQTNTCACIKSNRFGWGVSNEAMGYVGLNRGSHAYVRNGTFQTSMVPRACPLLREKRTCFFRVLMSAFDPKRTSRASTPSTSRCPAMDEIKPWFTATATATRGRNGHSESSDSVVAAVSVYLAVQKSSGSMSLAWCLEAMLLPRG